MVRVKLRTMTEPGSNPTDWWTYVEEGLERVGINQSRLAVEIGISAPSLSRWRTQGVTPSDPETVRAVAFVLKTPIVDALCALGYLTQEETQAMRGIANYSNRELLDEIERRMLKD